jgi:predicted transcriptional regulator
MWEAIFLACVSGAMLGIATHYYNQIRKLHKEYEQAKELVQDIIISFNKQLQGQSEKLGLVAYKTEIAISKADDIYKSVKNNMKLIEELQNNEDKYHNLEHKVMSQLEMLEAKIRDIRKSQDDLVKKVSEIKEREEISVESAIKTVIPIKREKALAPLNHTELEVLKILAEEGEKSAPQIRARINLSREHTARLMKKLYEEGYLERDTRKIPYTYKIKEEMRSLLKKVET